MDATTLSPDAPLPSDVATLQAMVRQLLTELAKPRAENAELQAKLDAALKHRFGRRSERRTPPLQVEPCREMHIMLRNGVSVSQLDRAAATRTPPMAMVKQRVPFLKYR